MQGGCVCAVSCAQPSLHLQGTAARAQCGGMCAAHCMQHEPPSTITPSPASFCVLPMLQCTALLQHNAAHAQSVPKIGCAQHMISTPAAQA